MKVGLLRFKSYQACKGQLGLLGRTMYGMEILQGQALICFFLLVRYIYIRCIVILEEQQKERIREWEREYGDMGDRAVVFQRQQVPHAPPGASFIPRFRFIPQIPPPPRPSARREAQQAGYAPLPGQQQDEDEQASAPAIQPVQKQDTPVHVHQQNHDGRESGFDDSDDPTAPQLQLQLQAPTQAETPTAPFSCSKLTHPHESLETHKNPKI